VTQRQVKTSKDEKALRMRPPKVSKKAKEFPEVRLTLAGGQRKARLGHKIVHLARYLAEIGA